MKEAIFLEFDSMKSNHPNLHFKYFGQKKKPKIYTLLSYLRLFFFPFFVSSSYMITENLYNPTKNKFDVKLFGQGNQINDCIFLELQVVCGLDNFRTPKILKKYSSYIKYLRPNEAPTSIRMQEFGFCNIFTTR